MTALAVVMYSAAWVMDCQDWRAHALLSSSGHAPNRRNR